MAFGPQLLNFSCLPWFNFSVDGRSLLGKGLFNAHETEASYEVAVFDGCRCWHETISSWEFDTRFTELNPNVEATVLFFMKELDKGFSGFSHGKNVSLHKRGNEATLELKWKIQGGVPLYWKFYLSASNDQLSKQLIQPSLLMIAELLRRQRELGKILKKKDKEIQDYKDQGATISRKQLLTSEFNMQSFNKQCNTSQEFTSLCDIPHLSVFQDEQCQSLYRCSMNNLYESDDSQDGLKEQMCETQPVLAEGRACHQDPTRRTPEAEISDSTSEKGDSAASSPAKANSPSASKDIELIRRDAIRRHLAEEEEKKIMKSKRKKINL